MWYLILQIILCLLLAFILGYLIARLLKMSKLKTVINELELEVGNLQNGHNETYNLTSALQKKYDSFDPKLVNQESKIIALETKLKSDLTDKDFDGKFNTMDLKISNINDRFNSHLLDKDYDGKIDKLQSDFESFYKKNEVDEKLNEYSTNISILKNDFNSELKSREYEGTIDKLSSQLERFYPKGDVDEKLNEFFNNSESLKSKFSLRLEQRDSTIRELEERIKLLENPTQIVPKDDDLKRISGVGVVLEKLLHENGIRHFKQIAQFTDEQIDSLSDKLGSFHDRIKRDNWMKQAKMLHLEKYNEEL